MWTRCGIHTNTKIKTDQNSVFIFFILCIALQLTLSYDNPYDRWRFTLPKSRVERKPRDLQRIHEGVCQTASHPGWQCLTKIDLLARMFCPYLFSDIYIFLILSLRNCPLKIKHTRKLQLKNVCLETFFRSMTTHIPSPYPQVSSWSIPFLTPRSLAFLALYGTTMAFAKPHRDLCVEMRSMF